MLPIIVQRKTALHIFKGPMWSLACGDHDCAQNIKLEKIK